MSEIKNNYQWKIGRTRLNETTTELIKANKVLWLIRLAEEKHANLIAYGNMINGPFPELRAKAMRDAGITLMAHARLVKYFNLLISDINL